MLHHSQKATLDCNISSSLYLMWRNSFRTLEAVGIFAICGALSLLPMPFIYVCTTLACENVTIHTGLTAVIVLCT